MITIVVSILILTLWVKFQAWTEGHKFGYLTKETIEVEHWRMLWQLGWLLWDDSPEWSEEKQDIYLSAADASSKVLRITSYESMVGG